MRLLPNERLDKPHHARQVDSHQNLPAYAEVTVKLAQSVEDTHVAAWVEVRDAMQERLEDPARAGREYEGYFGPTALQDTIDGFLNFDLLITAGT